ncbi:MAG: hypothetical protein Q9163_004129 [Psora crenata]
MDNKPALLEPSELGTKEYWDAAYSNELAETTPDPDSPLGGWFSDANASSQILEYLSSPSLGLDKATTKFLDLGTGNGEMLFLLLQEGGFRGDMVGVDYSRQSIELCTALAKERNLRLAARRTDVLLFQIWDVMRDAPYPQWADGFDVVLDKGTFDAISLSDEKDAHGRRLCEGYSERVEPLVKEGGILLVTSCNWTEPELKKWVESEQGFEAVGRVGYPIFSFGGGTGQSVCSVCFRRKGKIP